MKKIYALFATAMIIATANAAVPTLNPNLQFKDLGFGGKVNKESIGKTGSYTSYHSSDAECKGRVITGMRKADAKDGIEGIWTFSLGDYYGVGAVAQSIKMTYIASFQSGELWFNEPSGTELPMVCSFDESSSTIKFTKQLIGMLDLYYVFQEPFVFNYQTLQPDYKDIYGTYDADKGTISFEKDNAIFWNGYADRNGSPGNYVGGFAAYDLESAVKVGDDENQDPFNEEQPGYWTTIGNVTYVDPWIIPGYKDDDGQLMNPYDYPYEVELQQNNVRPSLYRLWKPYTTEKFELYEYNQSIFKGQIQMDFSDPANVVVGGGVPCGFKNDLGEFYVINEVGYWVNYWGGMVSASAAADVIKASGKVLDAYDYDNHTLTINYPQFDFTSLLNDTKVWNPMRKGLITFPADFIPSGIEGIINDINAPARYYNLQGVEIANPESGKLYIKVEGGNSSKVIAD